MLDRIAAFNTVLGLCYLHTVNFDRRMATAQRVDADIPQGV